MTKSFKYIKSHTYIHSHKYVSEEYENYMKKKKKSIYKTGEKLNGNEMGMGMYKKNI